MKISQLLAIPLLTTLALPFAAQASVEKAIAQSTTEVNAEALLEEIAELQKRPCDGYNKTVTKQPDTYNICGSLSGGRGSSPTLSAASQSSNVDEASVLYTYHYNGKVAAITYFEGDGFSTFAFDRNGKLRAELTNSSPSLRTTFTQKERDRFEKAAREGGENILSKFDSTSKQIAPKTGGNRNLCNRAISQGKIRLESIPNVKVTINSQFRQLGTPYPDAEAGLNRQYIFTLNGNGVADVWKATEMRTEIARQVISSCVGTAAVTFGRDRTGESVTIGLFPDGSIKQFTCAGDADPRTRKRVPPITWGRQACDL
ncbi:MAG: hypothetical protein DCE90_19595 [Pseudanabaena sp.]|nr:MAG: hypothetical protein DCE90_19595 [Pseudanabaena sp.]